MTRKLGVYWSVMHRRPSDYDYFKRLQPSVFKLMDGGQPDYQWARDNLPNSLILARDWALSEQHDDMLRDPVGTGTRHAQEWNQHQARLGFDKAKTLILGINEPHVWNPGVAEALRKYTIALCEEAASLGLRVGAMQLGVGWPGNHGPDTPPDWSAFEGVEQAIKQGNHALICHEYWADNGPKENWGWWAGRTLKCPWQVPIIIGECGIDMYVKDGSVEHIKRGWNGRVEASRYAAELAEYEGRMSADGRFVGCCVFASDFANREWFSFDIEPAYSAILATPVPAQPTTRPVQTHLPQIGTGPSVPVQPQVAAFVIAQAGANLRATPNGDILTAVPFAEEITITGVANEAGWIRARYGDVEGWMASSLVSLERPKPAPTPQPTGDNWQRSLQWVLKWEGGWADNPADPGGATMKGITIGTYTRWRQAHGQPPPTKDDLRNISDAEVEEIYKTWFWEASGASNMSWPMCLAVFDLAVNGGVERAKQALSEAGHDFVGFMAWRIDWYTRISNFEHFGKAWIRRCADLMREATK